MQERLRGFGEQLWNYLPVLVQAVLVLVIGWILIGLIVKWGRNRLVNTRLDSTLVLFFSNMLRFVLKILLLLAVAGMLGVETTSFLAVLGAAGLAVGLALKDSLSHFASGILIIIFRPFRVEDLIVVPNVGEAWVEHISILFTYLRTFDNRSVVVPNGILTNGAVINLTTKGLRRVDMPFGIAYSDDLARIRGVMLNVVKTNPLILKDPEPRMTVDSWADSSVAVTLRVWCKSVQYYDVWWSTVEALKNAFDAEGIEIPFPHQVTINKFPEMRPVFTEKPPRT